MAAKDIIPTVFAIIGAILVWFAAVTGGWPVFDWLLAIFALLITVFVIMLIGSFVTKDREIVWQEKLWLFGLVLVLIGLALSLVESVANWAWAAIIIGAIILVAGLIGTIYVWFKGGLKGKGEDKGAEAAVEGAEARTYQLEAHEILAEISLLRKILIELGKIRGVLSRSRRLRGRAGAVPTAKKRRMRGRLRNIEQLIAKERQLIEQDRRIALQLRREGEAEGEDEHARRVEMLATYENRLDRQIENLFGRDIGWLREVEQDVNDSNWNDAYQKVNTVYSTVQRSLPVLRREYQQARRGAQRARTEQRREETT